MLFLFTGAYSSVPTPTIDETEWRFAAFDTADIVGHLRHHQLRDRQCCNMRRRDHLRMVPEGMLARKRFALKHVDHRAAELALVQGGKQILLVDMATAGDVDDARAARQLCEGRRTQDARG